MPKQLKMDEYIINKDKRKGNILNVKEKEIENTETL